MNSLEVLGVIYNFENYCTSNLLQYNAYAANDVLYDSLVFQGGLHKSIP